MPKPARRAARLQRSASRLRRLASAIRPSAPERKLRRRLLDGRSVLASETGRTWQDIVAKPTGLAKVTGGRSKDGDHPSRKHGPAGRPRVEYLVTNPPSVPRRERRAHERAVFADNARRARAQRPAQRRAIETAVPSRAVRRFVEHSGPEDRQVVADLQEAHKVQVSQILDKAVARQMARHGR